MSPAHGPAPAASPVQPTELFGQSPSGSAPGESVKDLTTAIIALEAALARSGAAQGLHRGARRKKT